MSTSPNPRSSVKRDRPSTPPSPRKRPMPATSAASLWLDALPPELSGRIAAHLSAGKPTTSTLNLVLSSLRQQRAILPTFPRTLTLDRDSDMGRLHTLWPALHTPTTLHISPNTAPHPLYYTVFSTARALDALSLPAQNIESPNADPAEARINLRRDAPNLRKLHITLADQSLSRYSFRALSGLTRLRHLALECASGPLCVFIDHGPPAAHTKLASVCPQLTALSITCRCNSPHASPWRVITGLPRLCELSISVAKPAPEVVFPRLAELVKVCLRAPNAYDLAVYLGDSVTELGTSGYCLDGAQVAALTKCPRLETMDLFLEARAERALAVTLRALPFLRHLHLTWAKGEDEEYLAATPGVIFRAVEAAPRLIDVKLASVRVQFEEVTAIMKLIGKQLRRLAVPILQQDELPFDRMELLLYAACQNNSGLRSLSVSDEVTLSSVAGTESYSAKRVEALLVQGPRLSAAMRRLKQISPPLEADSLEMAIRGIQLGCLWERKVRSRGSYL